MPVNWEQLHGFMKGITSSLAEEASAMEAARASALLCLQKYAADPRIAERVDAIVTGFDPNLRCALPGGERLDAGYPPDADVGPLTLIAADGSQVTPDRHDQVQFGIVNIGSVTMRGGSSEAPLIATDTTILYGDRLYSRNGQRLSEGDIALLRDQGERASLLRLALQSAAPMIALTDGPLELWGGKDVSDPKAFEAALRTYLSDLSEMKQIGCGIAGYVDKPGADLVVRLFEILEARPEDLKNLRLHHPLRGVTDRWLFGHILGPRQRSAVLGLQSSSRTQYQGDISIHFFYLNVGSEGHPAIARIEIPKWVAVSADRLSALHAVLLEQCSLLGTRPYPYILHRAHETARITHAEKEEIGLRLLLDLREAGMELEDASGKSTAKASSGVKGSH